MVFRAGLDFTFAMLARGNAVANVKSIGLVPTFRSSRSLAALRCCELRKVMGTSKPKVLVPLFDLKSLGRTRRLQCRDFRSAALTAVILISMCVSGPAKAQDAAAPFDGDLQRL